MTTTKQRLEQAERRLAEVEALAQAARVAGQELASYRGVLERKLDWLQQADGPATVPLGPVRKPAIPPASETQRMFSVKPPEPPPAPPRAEPKFTPLPAAEPAAEVEEVVAEVEEVAAEVEEVAAEVEEVAAEVEEVVAKPVHPASAAFAAADEDDGSERRSAPRRKGNPVPVKVNDPHASTEPLDGWVVDRSSGGVRILTDQSFKPGSHLAVRPAKAHAGFPWIKIEVRSCSPERGAFSLGCMFLQKPSWAELQGFG